jgi:endoglucanase
MPYYGFNFQWMFSSRERERPDMPDEKALDFLARQGFNFARLPMDYRFWVPQFDYFHPDEDVFQYTDRYLAACRERKIHLSLNLHRAPGYCINGNELERHNLWRDAVAQDAFIHQWEILAKRYRGVPASQMSFDLINEPPEIGEYGFTRETHEAVIRRAVRAVRSVDPQREIVIDGLGGGNWAMPELADLSVIHSGRGYQPMPVSHHGASWWKEGAGLPEPVYPGLVWRGSAWNREALRAFYEPWRRVEAAGARVHIGECGCFNRIANAKALRWLGDLFGLFREFGWGFALWNFEGSFGVVSHGRPGARYVPISGYEVDPQLLELILENRVADPR